MPQAVVEVVAELVELSSAETKTNTITTKLRVQMGISKNKLLIFQQQ